jgi:hypothetical protein
MFWLILLARPRRRRITINHVHWKHPRLHNPWYWLSGLAFTEVALWMCAGMLAAMAVEFAGELLAIWWLLWLAAKGTAALVARWRHVPEPVSDAITACRPLWPSREAVQRHIAQSQSGRVMS